MEVGELRSVGAQMPLFDNRYRTIFRQSDGTRMRGVAAVASRDGINGRRGSRADHAPIELQIHRADARVLMIASEPAH